MFLKKHELIWIHFNFFSFYNYFSSLNFYSETFKWQRLKTVYDDEPPSLSGASLISS
jgi:hypothetical protein